MPFIDKLNQLEAAKAKLAEMEQTISAERMTALANLPSEYGYSDLNSFIKALKSAQRDGGRRKARVKVALKSAKRTRAKITDETKSQVKTLVEEGKTGAEIAKALRISLPSVQNIKKALGLVKPRAGASS
ncbi:MAG: helix-turn-helix domain-containing protein [Opitutaceae bacterium]|nr:helix-turn-helix domain-containing protein [Opitutaceae bacterium]